MRQLVCVGLATLIGTTPAAVFAQGAPSDLSRATLEELMNIRVISAARKQQRAEDVAAAIFVITQDDIRRSGMTTLPEILRLAPGVQVARVNANKWAISIRGFNDVYANKLLVLIDGRSVYTRSFSGVFWDAQDMLISDIERIEVIRGPGGAVWGANAVNGVVNIITKSAADTQGAAVELGVGTFERDRVNLRFGGSAGTVAYRLYSQWSEFADSRSSDGAPIEDRSSALTGGFRLDWTRGSHEVMTNGVLSHSHSRPNWLALTSSTPGAIPSTEGAGDFREATMVARWTYSAPAGSELKVQGFHSNTHRDESLAQTNERTTDVDGQYRITLRSRHDVVMGGGFRNADLDAVGTFALNVDPDHTHIFNAFLQDEITLGGSVALMLGSKLEHETHAGWGLLPSARIMWSPAASHHLWGAVSRARRTPAAIDRTLRVHIASILSQPLPLLIGVVGNPDFLSEQLVQTEAGYRVRVGPTADLDLTVFRGRYTDLKSSEPLAPVLEMSPGAPHIFVGSKFANLMTVTSTGLEVSGRWVPADTWRIGGSYSGFHLTPRPDAPSRDEDLATFDGNAPRHQWQVHSSWWPLPTLQLDGSFYRVGKLRRLDVPGYSRLDVRGELRLSGHLSAVVAGHNLSRSEQVEYFGANSLVRSSAIPRSGRLQLRWRF